MKQPWTDLATPLVLKQVLRGVVLALGIYTAISLIQSQQQYLDVGLLSLVLMGVGLFALALLFSFWLFQRSLAFAGLKSLNQLISHFNQLQLWHQFIMYWAWFALLFLANLLSFSIIF